MFLLSKPVRSDSGRAGSARRVFAVGVALALMLALVAFTITLPPPGRATGPTNYRVITFGQWNDVSPAWSPDAKTIAYVSNRNGVWQIYAMSPDGTSNRAITPTSYSATKPSWSPDSSSIAFLSQAGSQFGVRVAFRANSTIRTIAATGTSPIPGGPEWGPDGTTLMFFTTSNGTRLVSYDFETSASTTIAVAAGGEASACWASRTEVVYSSLVNGSYQLLWADLDNGTRKVLVDGGSNSTAPACSAASGSIAYISNFIPPNPYGRSYDGTYLEGDYNVWAMTSDGSNLSFQFGYVPIAGEADPSLQPYELFAAPYTPGLISPSQDIVWSSNQGLIAYVAIDQSGMPEVCLWRAFISSFGASAVANSTSPSWSPDGVQLAFSSAQEGFYHITILNTTSMVAPLPFAVRGG